MKANLLAERLAEGRKQRTTKSSTVDGIGKGKGGEKGSTEAVQIGSQGSREGLQN